MQVGSRVIVKKAKDKWALGIATAVNDAENNATVLYDNGTHSTVALARMQICLYFATWQKSDVDKAWVDKYAKRMRPISYNIKDFFLLKKSQIVTDILLTCMFYWFNFYVFHNKLSKPLLRAKVPKGGASGLYQYKPTGDIITINPRTNVTCYDSFMIFGHEMVHARNWQIDWLKEHTFNPASGGHGKSFKRWAGPLREIAGIPLNTLHDLQEVTVDEDVTKEGDAAPEVETDTAKGKPQFTYVLLMKVDVNDKEAFYAVKSKDIEKLQTVKTVMRGKMGMTAEFDLRKSSNAPLLNAITDSKKNTAPNTKPQGGFFLTRLTESVFNAVMKSSVEI